jgi:hypothetical protein
MRALKKFMWLIIYGFFNFILFYWKNANSTENHVFFENVSEA